MKHINLFFDEISNHKKKLLENFIEKSIKLLINGKRKNFTNEQEREFKLKFSDYLMGKDIFYFRGQKNEEWEIIPSLFRNKEIIKLESNFVTNKMLNGIHSLGMTYGVYKEKNYSFKDIFSCLVDMQHYNIPTRLLDWSKNPLIALFFAAEKTHNKEYNGKVFITLDYNKAKYYLLNSDIILDLYFNINDDEKYIREEIDIHIKKLLNENVFNLKLSSKLIMSSEKNTDFIFNNIDNIIFDNINIEDIFIRNSLLDILKDNNSLSKNENFVKKQIDNLINDCVSEKKQVDKWINNSKTFLNDYLFNKFNFERKNIELITKIIKIGYIFSMRIPIFFECQTNVRSKAQSSIFSVYLKEYENIFPEIKINIFEDIKILHKDKSYILNELDNTFGIRNSSVFPDILDHHFKDNCYKEFTESRGIFCNPFINS